LSRVGAPVLSPLLRGISDSPLSTAGARATVRSDSAATQYTIAGGERESAAARRASRCGAAERMELVSAGGAAAFRRSRSGTGADPCPADACCSSLAGVWEALALTPLNRELQLRAARTRVSGPRAVTEIASGR